ncbi:helix-turn-helix transcriptional regulator [Pedobacter aquae]|uniref:Helix-turn-helix transcriptional regulator n=1 Tax=Pedobacter aquae TaxID=2605747 RepID=A0A5C0VJS1_9SPHI|nr:AraC family transcriptional regulator [Pedobacter aquae]QEK52339.1 helix-turn-helix transcriptional regulator [Pedobacter aquae]
MGFFSSVLIIVAVLSLVKVSILLLRKAGDKKANSLLSIFFFIVFLYSLQGFVIEAGYLKDLPWFYVWPLPIYALMHVVIFFYFKCILDKSITWKASYILLFIPFLLALLDVFLFSLKPATEKIAIINDAILNPADRFEKQYGLFALKEHFLIRYTWSLFALALIWIKFMPLLLNKGLEKHQKTTNKWILSFLIVLSAIVFSTFLLVLQNCYPLSLVIIGVHYSKILTVLFVGFILLSALPFYFPNTLYGFFEAKVQLEGLKNDVQALKICKSEDDKIKFGLDIEIFKDKLNKFENEQLYLSQNFDINVLASYLEIPIHHLSYFLNQHYNLSFAAYRNKLRMEHAIKLIQEGFLCESTIEALAWECGFVSRSAFSKTFKAVIGDNPSDYAAKFQLAF